MARPLRIEYPGALYHVMSRGNACQDIFLVDEDRFLYLENLKHCAELHNLIIHAYCLMGNHYHLLIETPDGNLSKAMRDINGNYAQKFNFQHDSVGHLLQGRYKAFLIEKEVYFLEVARYIVNNPVSAGVVDDPAKWQWSSYGATAGQIDAPEWLEVDFTLGLFGADRTSMQKHYRTFVREARLGRSPYEEVEEGVILGTKPFIDAIWAKFQEAEDFQEVNKSDRMIGRPSLDEIFEDAHGKEDRDQMIRMARARAGYSVSEIARHLKIHRTTVSRIINES